jgi:flagellar FliJ protein
MAFAFRFQTLLNYKRQLEDMLEMKLAAATQRVLQERTALDNLMTTKSTTLSELSRQMSEGEVPLPALIQAEGYLKVLDDRIATQKVLLMHAEEAAEQARQELVEMMKQRKILEKLREKDLREFMHEIAKIESRTADEAYLARLVQRRRQGSSLKPRLSL